MFLRPLGPSMQVCLHPCHSHHVYHQTGVSRHIAAHMESIDPAPLPSVPGPASESPPQCSGTNTSFCGWNWGILAKRSHMAEPTEGSSCWYHKVCKNSCYSSKLCIREKKCMCLGDSPTFWSSVISPNPRAELVIPYYALVEFLPRPHREVGLYFCISQLIEIHPGLVFPTGPPGQVQCHVPLYAPHLLYRLVSSTCSWCLYRVESSGWEEIPRCRMVALGGSLGLPIVGGTLWNLIYFSCSGSCHGGVRHA